LRCRHGRNDSSSKMDNDDKECVAPVVRLQTQGRLFV
jgi:hypothetical protein